MRKTLAWMLMAVLVANTVAAPLSRETRKRIDLLQGEIKNLKSKRSLDWRDLRDLRGQRESDDMTRWVFDESLEAKVTALLKRAGKPGDAEGASSLDEAQRLLQEAGDRARDVGRYWDQVNAISWRDRWRLFAEANHLTPADPAPELLAAESSLLAKLAAGDFAGATSDLRALNDQVEVVMRTRRGELARNADPAKLTFRPRRTACPSSDGRKGTSARMTRAGDPEAFYPAGSKRREETGTIAVRVRVDAQNCATAFAVVVSSGFPDLDDAALEVAEASRYEAASENGQALTSELTFLVKFTIRK